MAGQIRYGEDPNKKKDQSNTPPITGGWGAGVGVPPAGPAKTPTPSATSTLPDPAMAQTMSSHKPWSEEQAIKSLPQPPAGGTRPSGIYQPVRGDVGGFGPNLPATTVATAGRTANTLMADRYGSSKLFGGKSIQQLIDDVVGRYGGMENMRARSSGLDVTSRQSDPMLGSYLQGLLEHGPSNRLENILLRRYYGNVGQVVRDNSRREDQSVGVSAAPDMLRDLLNAANTAENVGLDASTQALNFVGNMEAQRAQNLQSGHNQAVSSGTSAANNELDNLVRLATDQNVGGGRMSAAERYWNQNPDAILDENGQVDPQKVKDIRSRFEQSGVETLPGGAAAAPALPQRDRGATPAGVQAPRPGGPVPQLPQAYVQQLAQKGWNYKGVRPKGGQLVHVFMNAQGQFHEVPVQR